MFFSRSSSNDDLEDQCIDTKKSDIDAHRTLEKNNIIFKKNYFIREYYLYHFF